MKKTKLPLILLAFAIVLAILFFPVTSTYSISGNGVELTTNKEKTGECTLSVEIKEVKSLVMDYHATFSFVLNDESVPEFEHTYYQEADDGLCSISAMYYDVGINQVNNCGLLYHKDLSYAALHWHDKLYYLPNGTEMSYSEIPWDIGIPWDQIPA